MKKLITIFSLALLLANPVFAQDQDDTAPAPGGMMGMMGMMTDEQVEQMQAHLQEMQALMERVQQEDDPARRRELMQEHMTALREGMRMMGGGMMMGRGQGQGQPQGQGRGQGMNLSEEERLQRMQNHMAMMQMMMGQMMQHMAEENAAEAEDE